MFWSCGCIFSYFTYFIRVKNHILLPLWCPCSFARNICVYYGLAKSSSIILSTLFSLSFFVDSSSRRSYLSVSYFWRDYMTFCNFCTYCRYSACWLKSLPCIDDSMFLFCKAVKLFWGDVSLMKFCVYALWGFQFWNPPPFWAAV